MSDNVATCKRHRVADPLREFADRHADKLGAAIVGDTQTAESSAWHYLYRLAEQIDREHERRMEQCRRDTKRAFARYMRSVIEDYAVRNLKRTMRSKAGTRERDGYHVCFSCGEHVRDRPNYCPECGAKLIYKETGLEATKMATDAEKKTIGRNMRRILRGRGMSQKELAKAAGITECAVSKYVNGLREPTAGTFGKICDALGCEWSDLLDGVL